MNTEIINNVKIKPVIVKEEDEIVAGSDLFPTAYSNIFFVASKNSGKTNLLYNCLKKCVNKHTTVFLFAPTIKKDSTYKAIISMLEMKKCAINTYTDLYDDNGVDILKEIIHSLNEPEEIVVKPVVIEPKVKMNFGILEKKDEKPKTPKEKKKKGKIYAENIVCLDDFGSSLRSGTINQILKINRHTLKGKVFLLSHYITDIQPQAQRQLDYIILFPGQNEENLFKVYNGLGLTISFDDFMQAYRYATEKKYNFLYVDVKNNKLRKNFNEEINFN